MSLRIKFGMVRRFALAWCMACLGVVSVAQQPDAAAIIRGIDAAVYSRADNVLAFTDTEHYAVYRGSDETHPAAEMAVTDNYRKGVGKSYDILSQSGSSIIQKIGLHPLLENEKSINDPARVSQSWFTSANYNMKLRSGAIQSIHGRLCYTLEITPKREAPNMIIGRIWVDAKDYTLVKIEGIASKSPSPFAGTTHMMREYINIGGYSMAAHAHAESDSFLFGRTVVVIDYSNYHLQIKPIH